MEEERFRDYFSDLHVEVYTKHFTENVEQTETSNAGESSIATVRGWGVLIESSSKF